MDSRSDDCGVSAPGAVALGSGEEADAETLAAGSNGQAEWQFGTDDNPCLTEDDLKRWGLLPVPEWARKPPKSSQPTLFDDE